MTLQEIMNKDGLYIADGFRNGFGFKVKDGLLMTIEYETASDLFPVINAGLCYRELFNKDYKEVFTVKQLFMN